MTILLRIAPTLTLAAVFAAGPARAAEDAAPDARTLFVANCATCHGETGDGNGVTKLDRPARSFKDGGFSFGNTPEALYRTITTGIPGTPMPGFASALSDDERRAVAAYVRTLGPPVDDTLGSDAELVVGEQPVVVRGMLPPIVDGAPVHPRGLLVGTPSGLTFEYRADDLAFLGVRQGAFVRRTDWVGRGGTGLEPLGRVVYAHEGGRPLPAYEVATADEGGWAPLSARLKATRATLEPRLRYDLVDGSGAVVARVEETMRAVSETYGSGFRRDVRVEHLQQDASLRLRVATPGTEPAVSPFRSGAGRRADTQFHVARRAELVEAVGITGAREGFLTSPAGVVHAHLLPHPTRRSEIGITTLLLPEWTDEAQAAIAEGFGRR